MDDMENYKDIDLTEDDDEMIESLSPQSKKQKRSNVELRSRRQKFCKRWEKCFPWLKPDDNDEFLGFCTVCKRHLVCKKSHLQRHQKSFKHQRKSGFECVDADDFAMEPKITQITDYKKQDVKDEYEFEQAIEDDPQYSVECHSNPLNKTKYEETGKTTTSLYNEKSKADTLKSTSSIHITAASTKKLNQYILLKRINRDKSELNDYYFSHIGYSTSTNHRDSFDLFFESVSASVKSLPPILGAEVKNRVSQLIAEYELRAINERETVLSSVSSSENIPETSTHAMSYDNIQQASNNIDL